MNRLETPIRTIIGSGGTGGHLFPGVAIAQELVSRDHENRVLFVNTGKPFEKDILEKVGFDQISITAEGIKGRSLWRKVNSLLRIPSGLVQSMNVINRFGPDVVIGLGSYSAGVVVLGAWLKGIKTAVHEQNMIPGITNRILFRVADRIYVSFPKTKERIGKKNVIFTGNPVRSSVFNTSEEKREDIFTVLIVGGSQGAHRINTVMTEAALRIREKEKMHFIHQTGGNDEAWVKNAYSASQTSSTVCAFFNDMGSQYAKADMVICRAGATTVAEVTALGKPALFIPFPFAADNHQAANAGELADAGAAEVIPEDRLNGEMLAEKIEFYAKNRRLLNEMALQAAVFGKPNAASAIVDDLYQLAGYGRHRRKKAG